MIALRKVLATLFMLAGGIALGSTISIGAVASTTGTQVEGVTFSWIEWIMIVPLIVYLVSIFSALNNARNADQKFANHVIMAVSYLILKFGPLPESTIEVQSVFPEWVDLVTIFWFVYVPYFVMIDGLVMFIRWLRERSMKST